MTERSACTPGCQEMDWDIRRTAEHEVFRRNTEGEGVRGMTDKNGNTKEFLVAMRLWDTPVLIPNTMVKT